MLFFIVMEIACGHYLPWREHNAFKHGADAQLLLTLDGVQSH